MAKPIVAIVGRPNVGKSTLFNKLIGKRLAIVEDTPGVTRDRLYGTASWLDRSFLLIDTGGIEPNVDDGLLAHMRQQAQIAIDTANVILFVTDMHSGVTAQDAEIAPMLLRSGKPVLLVVNKVDSVGDTPLEVYDFYSLGLGEPYPVSSVHGHGTGDLLDAVIAHFPPADEEEDEGDRIPVAIIGRPNVGKSSLVNYILGEERMIVADEAGTTRDAVDTDIDNQYGSYTFIDTAGMRRRGKVEDGVERYSVLRGLAAVERARVAVIMIDAVAGFSEQDSKVAGFAHEQGKACIIAVNKWDAIDKDDKTMDVQRKKYENDFSFMKYAPIIFISAKTGQRVGKLMEMINYVDAQNAMRVTTGVLNKVLADATARVQPPTDRGRRLKIYYMTQVSTRPPTFACFINDKKLFHFSYQRYLENQIRATFGLTGTPVRMLARERGKKE
ncbi:ribosome biogenesis GTPase Der [Clostridia bacterium OttesenSCG-928-O13]|nr:ribosome biogenesis GTPase Der [Clostridia bacterium OttesenSCG-928-O13]